MTSSQPRRSVRIDNWFLLDLTGGNRRLSGKIKTTLGTVSDVFTTLVVRAIGNRVQTSGNVYVLGEPAKEYLEWLDEHGFCFDAERPAELKKREVAA